MADAFQIFRNAARLAAPQPVVEPVTSESAAHPFDLRNIHQKLPAKVRRLFDDGHYAEATFAAFKFLDKTVEKLSSVKDSGFSLMMTAFDEKKPLIRLTPLVETSEIDEQRGYRFIFAGATQAIRNPRGHEVALSEDLDQCLDHLTFASILLRRLEAAGHIT